MVKISDLNPQDPNKLLPGVPGSSAVPRSPARVDFSQQFVATQASVQAQSFEELVSQLDTQAQMLLRYPTPAQVAAYRDVVRRFLKEVNEKSGKTDKKTDRRNRTLVILRDLDEKLTALTDAILKGQVSSIDLAASVNEIRGLLLDLLI